MNVSFKSKKLKGIIEDRRKCEKEFGAQQARKLLIRLNDLLVAETLEDTRYLPGHYHELTGNRKGEWACDLVQPYRLVFTPHENPIPTDKNGKFIWIEIKGVEIQEIVDYHD